MHRPGITGPAAGDRGGRMAQNGGPTGPPAPLAELLRRLAWGGYDATGARRLLPPADVAHRARRWHGADCTIGDVLAALEGGRR